MPERVLHFRDFADDSAPGICVFEAAHGATDPHSHDFYEFVFIRSGFCLHEVQRKTELLVEGDCFLIRPGVTHRYVGPHTVSLYNCLFDRKALECFSGEEEILRFFTDAERSPRAPMKIHLDILEQKTMSRFFHGMLEDAKTRAEGWRLRVRCQFACLMVDYARAFTGRVPDGDAMSAYPNYVARALAIIEERFADPCVNVHLVAEEAGVSPDYLSRQFRLLSGIGVKEYLRRYRFAKAIELLNAGKSVKETAEAVGFSGICHFSREFKKEMGVSPTRYARLNGD